MKKLASLLTACFLFVSMSVSSWAEETPVAGVAEPVGVELNGETNLPDGLVELTQINMAEVTATGETIELPKARAGYQLEGSSGALKGTLTQSNPWDFYLFAADSTVPFSATLLSDNGGYTMTLGIVDFSTGEILLTDYVWGVGQFCHVGFENDGVLAWVIQSSNGTYGDQYQFCYNTEIDSLVPYLYVSDDLQRLYTYNAVNEKLLLNGEVEKTNYKYDIEYNNAYGYKTLHIWMENANVKPVHVGGCQWYETKTLKDYPNAIVLEVLPGGMFTHRFFQNPPYYNWGWKDYLGNVTPRPLTEKDCTPYSHHYLIYDLDTGNTVEFASGLTKTWSPIGDKHDLSTYK